MRGNVTFRLLTHVTPQFLNITMEKKNNGKRNDNIRQSTGTATSVSSNHSDARQFSANGSIGDTNSGDTTAASVDSANDGRSFSIDADGNRIDASGIDSSNSGGGRGRKRRSDYGTTRSRTDTGGGGASANETEGNATEIPLRVGTRRGRKPGSKNKKTESAFEQATLLGFIAIGLDAIYGSIALFAGSHWELAEEESTMLANSVNSALKTLPEEYYGDIKANIEKFIPWVGLAITAGAITIPRVNQTNAIRAQKRDNPTTYTDTYQYRNQGTNTDFANGFPNDTSL